MQQAIHFAKILRLRFFDGRLGEIIAQDKFRIDAIQPRLACGIRLTVAPQ